MGGCHERRRQGGGCESRSTWRTAPAINNRRRTVSHEHDEIDPISQLELDVLESGDLELATQVGEVARWAYATTVESLCALLCLPSEVAEQMVNEWFLR
ncbi:hypothetical protein SEA_RIALTO_84 [Mycobacterium phage Rialto]|nr:hypothetical protein SEA_RIALTO_84 [Mycobacterium phage Rialto]